LENNGIRGKFTDFDSLLNNSAEKLPSSQTKCVGPVMVAADVDEPDISAHLHPMNSERFREVVPIQVPIIFTTAELHPMPAVI
jgi:hypothetical protein